MKLIKFMLISTFLSACAAKQVQLGQDQYENIRRISFSTKLTGQARVLLESANTQKACKSGSALPRVELSGKSMEEEIRAKIYCAKSHRFVIASFQKRLRPGEYTVLVRSGELSKSITGVVVFKPLQEERFSGADQKFQGAQQLKTGVNEGSIQPSLADKTDWWQLAVDDFSRFSIVFTHDSKPGEVDVRLFRLRGTKLELVKTFQESRASRLALQGQYFLRVQGQLFGRNANYNISLKKTSQQDKGPVAKLTKINILDAWPINEKKSAILVSVGSNEGLKEGDQLKVFSAKGKRLLDACTLTNISELESECHISAVISSPDQIEVRSNL